MRALDVLAVLAPLLLAACGSTSGGSTPGGSDAGDAGAGNEGGTVTTPGDPPACSGTMGGGGSPSARGDHAGALDPTGTALVVFGGDTAPPGCPAMGAHAFDGQTWLLDVGCGVWTEIMGTGPSARARHAMATDGDGKRALLFGGRTRAGATGPYTNFSDVWAFDFAGQAWSQVTTSGTGPSPRSNAAIAVDAKGKQLVVFGGNTSTDGLAFVPQNDTFAMDLATGAWTSLATAGTKPPAREFHAMAIDPDARIAYVVSGGDANAFQGPFLHDVWALDLAAGTWSQVQTTGDDPAGRIKHGVAFDSGSKRLVLFGGHDDGNLGNQNDVHVLDVTAMPAAWKRLAHGDTLNKMSTGVCMFPPDFTNIDKASPERRSAFALGARVDGRGFVVHGGGSDCGLVADAWWWSDNGEAWTTMKASPQGQSCLRSQTTCSTLCGQ